MDTSVQSALQQAGRYTALKPQELRVTVFKLIRELLRNVVKHAGVRQAGKLLMPAQWLLKDARPLSAAGP